MLAIVDGFVVNDGWEGYATVLIDGPIIKAVLDVDAQIPSEVEQIVSARGKLIIPGGVDPHCHVDTKIGEFTTLDDYPQASEAALWGGTTTIIDFAIPQRGESSLDRVKSRLEQVRYSNSDVGIHGCIVEWTDSTISDIEAMADLGVRTIKMFTTYRDVVMVSADTLTAVIRELKKVGGIAYIHAESNHLIEAVHAEREAVGAMSASEHQSTRPEYTELAAVKDVISIAEALDSHVYFVHQSTSESVREITRARERGVPVYSETCPHYMFLSDEAYLGPEPERFVCCPPLRSAESNQRLRASLFAGEIQTIGSDHNCYSLEQKRSASRDVRGMPNGLPGVETRIPVVFSELVHNRGYSPQDFVRLVSANPARLSGMYPRKGVIAPGADADIVVFDPKDERVLHVDDLHMRTDYDPYEGHTVVGWPSLVISAGEIVVDHHGFHPREKGGEFVPSEPTMGNRIC